MMIMILCLVAALIDFGSKILSHTFNYYVQHISLSYLAIKQAAHIITGYIHVHLLKGTCQEICFLKVSVVNKEI